MPDPLRELIRDTLLYLKDPLLPKQTLLATAEDTSFFQKGALPKEALPIHLPKPLSLPQAIFKTPSQTPNRSPTPPKEPPPKNDFSQIKKILQKTAPALQLIDDVPTDLAAKRIANAWNEKICDVDVILLACKTDTDILELLKTLGKAIDQNLAKAKILSVEKFEVENRWDLFLQKNTFRLIIASEGMRALPRLMQFYRELPASAEYFLHTIPLLPLSSAPLYKSLEHKALLWKTLCRMLKKL
jgi:hypothetical protein